MVEAAFNLKEGSQSTELVIEDDLKAYGLSLGKSYQVVVEGASSYTMAIMPTLCAPPNANMDPEGGDCHCAFISSFCSMSLSWVTNHFPCYSGLWVGCYPAEGWLY